MINISGFGVKIDIVALQSFPVGFRLKYFCDDREPISIEDTEAVGYELQYDGGIVFFDKAAPIEVSVSVIPNSADDINLKILLAARKGGFKWLPIQDVTSMLISYPDGGRVAFSMGSIISGPFGDSIQSTGRRRSNTYKFVFGAYAGAQNSKQLLSTVIQGTIGLL